MRRPWQEKGKGSSSSPSKSKKKDKERKDDGCVGDGSVDLGGVDLQTRILFQMLQALTKRNDSEGLIEGGDLEGLKIMKAMSKMRALKQQAHLHPDKTSDDYVERWESDLNAEGKACGWTDVATRIPSFREMRSMHRIFVMFGSVEVCLRQSQSKCKHVRRARMQTVQCMKAVHQFANDKSWRTAWLLTYLSDPLATRKPAGYEGKLEGAQGYLKTLDEIDRRTKTVNKHLRDVVSGDEGEKGEPVDEEKKGKKGNKK